MNSRSLRVRLCVLYVLISTATMVALGEFSYWYLARLLASSSQRTMVNREERLLRFVNEWPASDQHITLDQKLHQLNIAVSSTDTVQLFTMDGARVYSSAGPSWMKLPWPNGECRDTCYRMVVVNGQRIRTLDHVVTLEGREYRLSLSGKIDEHFDVLRTVRNSYLFLCPLMVALSVAGGFLLSGRGLEPIHRITAEARKIGIQDLKRRIPVPSTGDELQVLAESWNQLLERLELAVDRLAQLSSDISHDLNTTITVMMTTAGLALSRERTPEEYRLALHNINVECEATTQLLGTLLAVARTDLVQQNIERQEVNLTEMVAEITQQFEPSAAVKSHLLKLRLEDDVWIEGDPSLLRRMLSILLDNAIKYTPESGAITISLLRGDCMVQIQVRDTGIGIPDYALTKIFDRLYMVDPSRAERGESSGLGLAIAKWVADAHRSTIEVTSSPGKGSTFTVLIPYPEQTSATDSSCAVLAR